MNREELAQEWRERLDDFAESSMSVQAWCDFHRVTIHQYYYWRRRLASPKPPLAPAKPAQAAPPRFLALDVVDTPTLCAPGGVTIRIAGAAIEVAADFDPRLLRAVVGALATPRC